MYKIIGVDGKEYGPITAEQLRQWIAEGRANLQTRVLPDGAAQWVTVADLPEFTGAPPPVPPGLMSPLPVAGTTPAGVNAVNGPAIGLMCSAGLGFLYHGISLLSLLLGHRTIMPMSGGYGHAMVSFGSRGFGAGMAAVGLLMGAVVLFGALKMKNLENYGLAMAASIIAMIPCVSPCRLLGLPMGIWAVVGLSKPEVKSAVH